MELGVHGLNTKATVGPDETVRLAELAEELGYGSWWVGDHVVFPSPRTPGGQDPLEPIVDPMVHLSYVAAVTERLELGTGVMVLPQRNPVVLAKQAASLDVLSNGRLLLGVGPGFVEPELNAVGVALSERGARTNEYLDAMTALWTQPAPAYHGEYVSFENVDAHPRPVQENGPRVLIGGHSPAAYRRAVARGHGWIGAGSSPTDVAGHLAGLEKAATEVERPARLGKLEITFIQVSPTTVDAQAARQYAGVGVDRLLVFPSPLDDPSDIAEFLKRHADLPR